MSLKEAPAPDPKQTKDDANPPVTPKSPAELIEALGFGHAQLRYLFLGHGIWFVEAMQLTLSVVLTVYVATNEKWKRSQRASLASVLFIGIAVGSMVGGLIADRYGRRIPILAHYAVATIVQLVMIISGSFGAVVVLRFFLGFAHGMGMPPSLALVSETSPVARRVFLQALRNILFVSGQIVGNIITLVDDGTYRHMNWRVDLFLGAIPPLLILLFAVPLLYESPNLLAVLGRDAEAKRSFEAIRYLNRKDGRDGKPAVDITFAVPAQQARTPSTSWWQQVKVVFGRHLIFSTLTLGVASFSLNCLLYGHMYAFPLVATANATHKSMTPGLQGLIQSLIAIPINIIILFVSMLMSRQKLLSVGCAIGIVGTLGFAWTAGLQQRTGFVSFIYYVCQNLPSVCCSCGFVAVYQLAIDLYPMQIAATSAGLIVVYGRIGSICVSYIFEIFTNWQGFYFFLAALCFLTMVMQMTLLASAPPNLERISQKEKELNVKAFREDVEAAQPFVAKRK